MEAKSVMLKYPGRKPARIPFPKSLEHLKTRIIKFGNGKIQEERMKIYEDEPPNAEVELEDFFDLFPSGGVTLCITNGEDYDPSLFAPKPPSNGGLMNGLASALPGSASSDNLSGSLGSEELTEIAERIAEIMTKKNDFWQKYFKDVTSVPWDTFVVHFNKHFKPTYKRQPKPENIVHELQVMLEREGHVSLEFWERFTKWFHPAEKIVQIIEDLRARGLIHYKGFIGFQKPLEETEVPYSYEGTVEEESETSHLTSSSSSIKTNEDDNPQLQFCVRFSETYSEHHGIWMTIVERDEERYLDKSMIEEVPLIYYKLLQGFTIPAYTDEVFETLDKLIQYVILKRNSTVKEYLTPQLREALNSEDRILRSSEFQRRLKGMERMRNPDEVQVLQNSEIKRLQKRLNMYNLQTRRKITDEVENSMFISLSLQIWGTIYNAAYLRREAVQWLRKQRPTLHLDKETQIKDLLEGGPQSLAEYCNTLSDRSTPGKILSLWAVAHVTKRPVLVVTSFKAGGAHLVYIMPPSVDSCQPLLLSHCWPNLYEPLEPRQIDPRRPWLIEPRELEEGQPIGSGAQATVYEGRYKGIPVAIKRVVFTENLELTVHAFERELTMLQQLHCTNIIQFLGASLHPPQRLVFEYMAGGSLHQLTHTPLRMRDALMVDPKARIHIAQNIAAGMCFLHNSNIMHCDLTPKNVLLDEHYKAKVADFGLSRFRKSPGHFHQMGNFAYVAPEIFAAQTAARFDYPADVYSFGMILWELWTGHFPYRQQYLDNPGRPGDVPSNFIRDICTGWRPALPDYIPEPWKELIQQCWHQDPSRRPTFAELMAEGGPLQTIERMQPEPDQRYQPALPVTNLPAHETDNSLQDLNLRDVY